MESTFPDVMTTLRSIGAIYSSGDYESSARQVEQLWDSLPGNSADIPNAYLIVEYAVAIQLKRGDLASAKSWAERGLAFRAKRHDLGEAEFLLGKVAYEQGALDEARDWLALAATKSNGKILSGEDPKYRNLLKSGH